MMTGLAVIMVPVLLDKSYQPAHLLEQWVCLFNYGHRILPAISITVLCLYGYIGYDKYLTGGAWIAYGTSGILTVGIIPFTLIVMQSTNDLLFQQEEEIRWNPKVTTLEDARKLIAKWSSMHFVRSMFPLAGAVLGFSALCKEMRG
jgi:hypothetical protein